MRNPFFAGRLANQFRRRGAAGQRQRDQFPFQSDLQHLIHGCDEVEIHFLSNIFWNIGEVLLIVFRKDQLVNPLAVGSQKLFL